MIEIKNKGGDRVVEWSCVLTNKEIALLAEGIDPLLIRPDKLIYYAPLLYQEHIYSVSISNISLPDISS